MNSSAITEQGQGTIELNGNVTVTGGIGTSMTNGLETREPKDFRAGGGVYVKSGAFHLVNGTISGNTAQRGGGIFVNLGANLIMEGGSVTSNKTVDKTEGDRYAGEGGGIFVWGTATISRGSITNNTSNSKCDLGGGGLYVNNDGKATLINAIVTDNTAGGFGGGIAGCCHGEMSLVATDGVALYGNTAYGNNRVQSRTNPSGFTNGTDEWNEARDKGITGSNSADFYTAGSSIISNYMTGGGSAKYDVVEARSYRLQDTEVKKITTQVALKANPSADSIAKIPAAPTEGVLISNNTANNHGGGIGCNGGLYFGSKEDQKIEFDVLDLKLDAQKTMKGDELKDKQFTFELLWDETGNVIATATNGKDGGIHFALSDFADIKSHITPDNKITLYVREAAGGSSDIKYDRSVYQIVIPLTVTPHTETVQLEHTGEGTNGRFKEITVTYTTNTYTAGEFTITKIKNKDGNDVTGETLDTISFVNEKVTSLDVKKRWVEPTGGAATKVLPESITVTLLANDTPYKELTLNASNNWQGKFDNLPVVDESDTKIDYTMEEPAVEGWTGAKEETNTGFVFTNTREVGSLTLTKRVMREEDDNHIKSQTDREYTFKVTGPSAASDPNTYEVKLKDGQSETLKNLIPGEYRIEELNADVEGWDLKTKGTGNVTVTKNEDKPVTIENEYKPKMTSIDVTKKWKEPYDGEDADTEDDDAILSLPDSITVYVYKTVGEGPETETGSFAVLNAANQWHQTIDKLPMVDEKTGEKITYRVAEVNVEGWEASNGGKPAEVTPGNYVFTNVRKVGKLEITKKVEGLPEKYADKTYTFNIYGPRYEKEGGHQVTLKAGETVTLENLIPGDYKVLEGPESAKIDGWTVTVTGQRDEDNKITVNEGEEAAEVEITNRYEVKKTSIKVEKKWIDEDGNPATANIPRSIVVNLYRCDEQGNLTDENVIDTLTLNAANEWKGRFEDLPLVDVNTGDPINYTVREVIPTGWVNDIKRNEIDENSYSFTIINTRISGSALSVSKTVTGYGDTSREFNFTVTLSDKTINGTYGDMEFTDGVAEFKLKHNETKSANQLPAGITYEVTEKEANADGYSTSSEGEKGTLENGEIAKAEFTNYRRPSDTYTSRTVRKVWVGDEGANVRPTSITVELYREISGRSEKYGEATLSASNNWTHTWTGLPSSGTYSIREVNVPEGYQVFVDQSGQTYTITNTWNPVPLTAPLSVNKVWAGDQGVNVRPNSVEVQLYKDGVAEGNPVTLNAENGWAYSWMDLDTTATYTVREVSVPAGYTASVTQDGLRFTITNTYNGEEIPDEPDTPRSDRPDEPTENIPNPDVPLASTPGEPTKTVVTTIPEPNVPLASAPTETIEDSMVPLGDAPKTGDNSPLALWTVLMLGSLLSIAAIRRYLSVKRSK